MVVGGSWPGRCSRKDTRIWGARASRPGYAQLPQHPGFYSGLRPQSPYSGSRSLKCGDPSKKSAERRHTSPRCKKCSPLFTSSACTTPRRTRTSRVRLWCSRTTRGAWKAKGKKVLPILGSVGGKADQEGDREKEKGEDTSATKERAEGKLVVLPAHMEGTTKMMMWGPAMMIEDAAFDTTSL